MVHILFDKYNANSLTIAYNIGTKRFYSSFYNINWFKRTSVISNVFLSRERKIQMCKINGDEKTDYIVGKRNEKV